MIIKNIEPIKRINLHLHTTVSDGILSPVQLVKRARQINLDLISITDHDTSDAYQKLPQDIAPLRIIPGMEISSLHEGSDVHILALGCDFTAPIMVELTDMYLIGRRNRAIKMIEKLAELGMDISLDEVIKVAGSRELIVRPHIAQILLNKGYVSTKNEAFDKFIGNNKPAYEAKPELTTSEAIKIIHSAGGWAILAHPGKLEKREYIHEFIGLGADGLEVWHPDHYQSELEDFMDICRKNKLYMTAGSDFHGYPDSHNLFDAVPANDAIIDSVNRLWKEYLCRVS